MNLIENLTLIYRLHRLIKMKSTGPPKSLAEKVGISERKVYRTIKTMIAMGAPIKYCHHRLSYIYERDVSFDPRFR